MPYRLETLDDGVWVPTRFSDGEQQKPDKNEAIRLAEEQEAWSGVGIRVIHTDEVRSRDEIRAGARRRGLQMNSRTVRSE